MMAKRLNQGKIDALTVLGTRVSPSADDAMMSVPSIG